MTDLIPLTIPCAGHELVGLLHPADGATGVVLVVGGPQYRVGSHRQFLLLARRLAEAGFPVLRFDCRGMGDSDGQFPGFEQLDTDIRAAIDVFKREVPHVQRLALWGLCDAASAILMYAPSDDRVDGAIILNPWVRTESGHARAQVRHYYAQRILNREFWTRLLTGKVDAGAALRDFLLKLKTVLGGGSDNASQAPQNFVDRMRLGLAAFKGEVLCVLSGQDITAAEFSDLIEAGEWQSLMTEAHVTTIRMPAANHTFATAADRGRVEKETIKWLHGLADGTAREATS